MNIAIYARVSSDTQAKEGTIESQIEALRDHAKAHHLNIVYECLDDGYSGATLDRPGLDELRDLAQAGSIEGVLILSPDRLSRKQAHQALLIDEFKRRNIQITFTSQKFEDNAEGNLMFNIQGLFAEYEREKILDRTRRGIIHATKNGQIIGANPPYGYRYIPKSKTELAHWEINPEEAKVVRYIFDLYVNQGVKGTAIGKRLFEEGISNRTEQAWISQVYTILRSEVYKGTAFMFRHRNVESKRTPKSKEYRKHKNKGKELRPRDEWIGIPVTPIIEENIWSKAQEILKQNIFLSRRNNNVHEYLMRGLMICGYCGSMASGYVSNKHTYYSCGAKRRKNIYTKQHDEVVRVKHKAFDEKVWFGLVELMSDPDKINMQIEKRLKADKKKPKVAQDNRTIDKQLEHLNNQEKRAFDAYLAEAITLQELKEQKEKIGAIRNALQAKKKPAERQAEGLEWSKITMSMLNDVSIRFLRVMKKADFPTREKIVNLLVGSVTLMTDKAIVKGNIPVDDLDALTKRHARASHAFNQLLLELVQCALPMCEDVHTACQFAGIFIYKISDDELICESRLEQFTGEEAPVTGQRKITRLEIGEIAGDLRQQ